MAIKIGHASVDEYGKAAGGDAGDQTGGEVCIRSWYNGNWNVLLRPKSADLAEKQADAMEKACANPNIGYDQGSRNTAYHYAKLVGFDLSKVADQCETDCSALVHLCAIAGGAKLSYGVNGLITWNMVAAFEATGQYEKLTDAQYLTSERLLRRGDILVRESGHTAIVLENGAEDPTKSASETTTASGAIVSVSLPMLRKGGVGAGVFALQMLLTATGFDTKGIDGEFGANTEGALRRFQLKKRLEVDGVCGRDSWTALLKETEGWE